MDDLNVAYDDIITSTKEHLQMNAAIMRKEKEVKELEARVALLQQPVDSDEYHALFQTYEHERRTLNEIMTRTQSNSQAANGLQSRIDYASNNINALRQRISEVEHDIQLEIERYNNLKTMIPPKVRYVVEEVEDQEYEKRTRKVRSSRGSEGDFGS